MLAGCWALLMSSGTALDTDVLLKVSGWRLADELLQVLVPYGQPGALGLTHLIAPKQIRRKKSLHDLAVAESELIRLLARLHRIEPTPAEVELAAEIVEAATVLNLPLDVGEAQIMAVLICRALALMVTGDKRAIGALDATLRHLGRAGVSNGRIACLEQALMAMAEICGYEAIRTGVCSWPVGDVAAAICFGCGRESFDETSARDGLESYIRSVREAAGSEVLCAGITVADSNGSQA